MCSMLKMLMVYNSHLIYSLYLSLNIIIYYKYIFLLFPFSLSLFQLCYYLVHLLLCSELLSAAA